MPAIDLFHWREEAEAAARLAEAEQLRAQAERARRYAPKGTAETRQARLAQATAEALKAEITLDRVRRGDAS